MENIEVTIWFSVAGFVLGWIGSEINQYYEASKNRRRDRKWIN
jgi:hypothetical protein